MSGENAEKALGKQLQAARQAAGLTQQELCHKSGLSYSTLAKIERGAIKAPSIFTIASIAHALGTSLNELMGDVAHVGKKAPVDLKKTSKSGIKFVYFDINGCLVRFFHQAFGRIAEDTGAPAELVETTFWHYDDAACRGDMTMKDFDRALATRIGVDKIDFADYFLDAVEPIKTMQKLVVEVAQDFHVGLLSNIMPGLVDGMKKRGLLPKVDYTAIVDSSEVGSIKPEAKIFEVALKQSGCQPSEILFVDDNRMNVMAAEKMGWKVLWFDDYHPEETAKRIKSCLEL